jgi:serine/threonine-protein kinase
VDLYALGCVAYYLLTGAPLFEGGNLVEICSHHVHTIPEPPSQRLGRPIPKSIEELVLKCLAKNPDERFASARELAKALRKCMDETPWAVGTGFGSAKARAQRASGIAAK